MKLKVNNIPKPLLLMTLYNNAKPQADSFTPYEEQPMNINQAKNFLKDKCGFEFEDSKNYIPESECYIDSFKGRTLKADISGEIIDLRLYQRYNNHIDIRKRLKNINDGNLSVNESTGEIKFTPSPEDKKMEYFANKLIKIDEYDGKRLFTTALNYVIEKCKDVDYPYAHIVKYLKEYDVYPFDNDPISSKILCGGLDSLYHFAQDEL